MYKYEILFNKYILLVIQFRSITQPTHNKMRKREIQSFTLKLADLSDFELLRVEKKTAKLMAERNAEIQASMLAAGGGSSGGAGGSGLSLGKPPLVKYGPKSKQEIRGRLGYME